MSEEKTEEKIEVLERLAIGAVLKYNQNDGKFPFEEGDIRFSVANKNETEQTKNEIQEFIIRVSKAVEKGRIINSYYAEETIITFLNIAHNLNHEKQIFAYINEPHKVNIEIIPKEEYKEILQNLIDKLGKDKFLDIFTNILMTLE